LCGIWMAIGYAMAGIVCFMLFFLIITIPFGIAAFRIASYVLWPFGQTIEPRRDAGVGSLIGNILWIILFAWWLGLAPLITGIAPGVPNSKIITTAVMPLGVQIVPSGQPYPGYRR